MDRSAFTPRTEVNLSLRHRGSRENQNGKDESDQELAGGRTVTLESSPEAPRSTRGLLSSGPCTTHLRRGASLCWSDLACGLFAVMLRQEEGGMVRNRSLKSSINVQKVGPDTETPRCVWPSVSARPASAMEANHCRSARSGTWSAPETSAAVEGMGRRATAIRETAASAHEDHQWIGYSCARSGAEEVQCCDMDGCGSDRQWR